MSQTLEPFSPDLLLVGVRSRFVDNGNGLRMHVLEAGYEENGRPTVVLLHGFPELAYCWRKVMMPLAEHGYHVIAPDQRGYGKTTGADTGYDCDLDAYRPTHLAQDVAGLLSALRIDEFSVVGHDFGSPVAGYCALMYPERVCSAVFMSAPFLGLNPAVIRPGGTEKAVEIQNDIANELARLPRPRKHYHHYYCTREANENMWKASQGLKDFQRAYYHQKSADWKANRPHPLESFIAEELSKMPGYYIMDLDKGMAETVAEHMPSEEEIGSNLWMPDEELQVYTDEYQRTGYQGGLNWYRAAKEVSAADVSDIKTRVEQPSLFISGVADWGSHQRPGALERMQYEICTDMKGVHMVEGAGHWVQQEQPGKVASLLIDFLADTL